MGEDFKVKWMSGKLRSIPCEGGAYRVGNFDALQKCGAVWIRHLAVFSQYAAHNFVSWG